MEDRDYECLTYAPPYTEINRQESADKINDPVASGEAQAGRAVGAAGGSGNMNTTWTIAGQPPEKRRNIHFTFRNSYRFDRRSDTLSRCSYELFSSCAAISERTWSMSNSSALLTKSSSECCGNAPGELYNMTP